MTTSRELRVYNRFGELVLHLRFVPGDPLPLRVEEGTQELRNAVRSLVGRDFDETVVIAKQRQRFQAAWGSPEYLDALAGYWSSNFGWQTRIVEMTPDWGILQTKVMHDLTPLFKIDCTEGLVNYTQAQGKSFQDSLPVRSHPFNSSYFDVYFSEVTPASAWQSGQEDKSVFTGQFGSLFDTPTRALSIFSFYPRQRALQFLSYSTDFSFGYGVNQPTAMVRLKEHNPKLASRFAEKNPEAWAA